MVTHATEQNCSIAGKLSGTQISSSAWTNQRDGVMTVLWFPQGNPQSIIFNTIKNTDGPLSIELIQRWCIEAMWRSAQPEPPEINPLARKTATVSGSNNRICKKEKYWCPSSLFVCICCTVKHFPMLNRFLHCNHLYFWSYLFACPTSTIQIYVLGCV